MNAKERAATIFESLAAGYEVYAKRGGESVPVTLVGYVDGKCVAAVQTDDSGNFRLKDVSRSQIVQMKCETLFDEEPGQSGNGTNGVVVGGPAFSSNVVAEYFDESQE